MKIRVAISVSLSEVQNTGNECSVAEDDWLAPGNSPGTGGIFMFHGYVLIYFAGTVQSDSRIRRTNARHLYYSRSCPESSSDHAYHYCPICFQCRSTCVSMTSLHHIFIYDRQCGHASIMHPEMELSNSCWGMLPTPDFVAGRTVRLIHLHS